MNQLLKVYIWVLIFSPFLSYFVVEELELIPYYFWGSIGSVLAFLLVFKKNVRIPKLIFPLFLLSLYYFIWSFYNGRYDQFGISKLLFKDFTLHTISFMFIISNINLTQKTLNNIVKILKIFIIISTVFILIQALSFPNFFLPTYLQHFNEGLITYDVRNSSMWGYLHPNDIGLSFIPILALVLHNSIVNKSKLTLFWLFCGAVVSVLSNGRYVMVNFIVVLIYCGYLENKLNKGFIRNILKYVIAVFIISVISFTLIDKYAYDISDFYENRIKSESADSRLYGYEMFLKYFPERPWFGSGVRVDNELAGDLAGKSSQIHIGYFSHLYEFGIIGSILLFFIWYRIAMNLWRFGKEYKNYVFFVMFLCFLIGNASFVEYSIFHFGILLALLYSIQIKRNSVLDNLKTRFNG